MTRAIIIKRLGSIIFLLAIAAMAMTIAGFYAMYTANINSGLISDGQKSHAIAIALGDNYVESSLRTVKNYSIGEIARPSPGDYDYSGEPDRLTVPFRIDNGSVESVLFVTVDPGENRTISVYNDRPGNISEKQKMDFIKMALNDSRVAEEINGSVAYSSSPDSYFYGQAAYIIDNVTGIDNDTGYSHPDGNSYGYLNGTSGYVDVHLLISDSLPCTMVDVVVDTAKGTILADRFKGDGPGGDRFNITIPPGKSFYESFNAGDYAISVSSHGSTTVLTSNFSLAFDHRTADITYPMTVCEINGTDASGIVPIFVDADNFTKLKNGSAYVSMNDRIVRTDKGWIIAIPGEIAFSMVLNNTGSKDAMVSILA